MSAKREDCLRSHDRRRHVIHPTRGPPHEAAIKSEATFLQALGSATSHNNRSELAGDTSRAGLPNGHRFAGIPNPLAIESCNISRCRAHCRQGCLRPQEITHSKLGHHLFSSAQDSIQLNLPNPPVRFLSQDLNWCALRHPLLIPYTYAASFVAITCLGCAPTNLSTSLPFLNTSMVGML
jgi:hypothetical protein